MPKRSTGQVRRVPSKTVVGGSESRATTTDERAITTKAASRRVKPEASKVRRPLRQPWTESDDASPLDWSVALTHERVPHRPGCQPAVLSRYVYGDPEAARGGDYSSFESVEYASGCYGCDWFTTGAGDENAATEAAHAHAFPGYETLPVLTRGPYEPTKAQSGELLRVIGELYPHGWIERHGPIRTRRTANGTRHVPGRAPTGGYDLCGAVEHEPAQLPAPTQGTLF